MQISLHSKAELSVFYIPTKNCILWDSKYLKPWIKNMRPGTKQPKKIGNLECLGYMIKKWKPKKYR